MLAHIAFKLVNLISILVYVGVLHILMEVGVSICLLIGKLDVLVRNSRRGWDVVNSTALFTQVTNNTVSAATVVMLWHWHVKLNRL